MGRATNDDVLDLLDLLTCPWCLSLWVGLVVAVLRRVFPRAWSIVAAALASSAITGILSDAVKILEERDGPS